MGIVFYIMNALEFNQRFEKTILLDSICIRSRRNQINEYRIWVTE